MRQIIYISILVFVNITNGNAQLGTFPGSLDYYVYNELKDTLFLTNIDVGESVICKSTVIVDSIQIDDLGSKEIVFDRTYAGQTREIKQASQIMEDTKIHKYEIWNIDTKTLLFEFIDDYDFHYDNWILHGNNPNGNDNRNEGVCIYNYNFSIDHSGQIKIDINPDVINTANNCKSNKKEGIYRFINGKYIKE